MTPLARELMDRIRATGPITIAEYMDAALTHYYTTTEPFGRDGDFITAPEVSQMFGELIGLWLAMAWQAMGDPPRVRLAELGPGRGTLMADALRAAAAVPGFTEAVRLTLVERSPRLRARQADALAGGPVALDWADDVAAIPDGPLLVVANEFFDALPVHQFERTADGWRERLVTVAGGELAFTLSQKEVRLPEDLPNAIIAAVPGSLVEIRPAAGAVVHDLVSRIVRWGGALLVIDYGHGRSGVGDTLQAVKNHRYHSPLADAGEADLTAHVDFQALAMTASAVGGRVSGPVSQGEFLVALGIEARAARLAASYDAAARVEVKEALKRLIGEDEMGTLFKVLAVTAPGMPLPEGFAGAQPPD